jgi:hypothetical protein
VRELQRGTAKVSEVDCLARIRTYIQSAEILCGIPRAVLTASPSISPSTDFFFCVDAHRDGKRFIVKANDLLTAFLSLERDVTAPKGANSNGT